MSQTNKNGTLIMRMACAIFFLLFSILYLYDYQADILAVVQHVLSHGATHYNPVIGTIIITLVLWLIQVGIYKLTGLNRRGHALTYIPSILLLGILTDASPSSLSNGNYMCIWLWLFPLLMMAYAGLVYVVRQLEPMELPTNSLGLFSRMTWINLLQMVVIVLITCAIGNNDEVFHYRMRMESDILDGDFAKASLVGRNEEKTDSSLTLLRIWSLSKQDKLADNLFTYPLEGRSDAMIPNGTSVKIMMVPEVWFYKDLGVYFKEKMSPRKYLQVLNKSKYASKQSRDMELCAYLLDCNLDKFVATLPHYYNIKESLPQSYREALVLYTHLHEHPRIVYHGSVIDADYADFRKLFYTARNQQEQYSSLKQSYGKTYWFYYYKNSLKKQ